MQSDKETIEGRFVIGCGIVLLTILSCVALGLLYYFTGSLNPLDIYSVGTKGQIVIISMIYVIIGFQLIGLIGRFIQTAFSGARKPDYRLSLFVIICLVLLLVLLCSFWNTGSLNPIDVFKKGDVIWMTAVSFLLCVLAFQLIQFAFLILMIWQIEAKYGTSYRDVYCKFCNEELIVLFGMKPKFPFKCPHCHDYIHLTCWRKAGGSMSHRCDDPKCQPEQNLSDFYNSHYTDFS